jgi:hypothetical protein
MDGDTSIPMLTKPLPASWSSCTAIDPPLRPDMVQGLSDACGASAPYIAHLQEEPGDPRPGDVWAWFCPEHAGLLRADPEAVEHLVQLRTTTTTDRSTERP